MLNIRYIIVLLIMVCGAAIAETDDTERLSAITEDYAKCADVAVGNFNDDVKIKEAMNVLFDGMTKNIYVMIENEIADKNGKTADFVELVGKDIAVGYLLKGFVDVNPSYKEEKEIIVKENNGDWRAASKILWKRNGCNAIYESLKK